MAVARERAEHVVGFVAVQFQDRQAHGFAKPPDKRELNGELVGHLGAVRFVFLEKFVAEGGLAGVENDADVIGLIVFENPPQNIVEEKRHGGGDAARWCSCAPSGA